MELKREKNLEDASKIKVIIQKLSFIVLGVGELIDTSSIVGVDINEFLD